MLDPLDIASLVCILAISTLIGLYFGVFRGHRTVSDYLLSGMKMNILPVTFSLIASYNSGVGILGVTTDVYFYGIQVTTLVFSSLVNGLITTVVFLPVFYRFKFTSVYEYLALRFDNKVRIVGSSLYIITGILLLPFYLIGPSLILHQVTGINAILVGITISSVCISYTVMGGMKAVVWVDVLQCIVLVVSMASITWIGVHNAGGFGQLIETASKGDRLNMFDMSIGLTSRMTFWSAFLGFSFSRTAELGVAPGTVQRFIILPSFKQAVVSVWITCLFSILFTLFYTLQGLSMYAAFSHCDPFTIKAINRPNEILPYYLVGISKDTLGLTGLMLGGFICGDLSSVSTVLNALSATLYKDFVEPRFCSKLDERSACWVIKGIAFIVGSLVLILMFLFINMGNILEICYSLRGISEGALFGVFLLGFLVPTANARGAIAGSITSLIVMTWISVGANIRKAEGLIKYPNKPLSISGCQGNITAQARGAYELVTEEEVLTSLYELSPYYYGVVGTMVVILVGVGVSHLTGPNNPRHSHPHLFPPFLRKFLSLQKTSYNLPEPIPLIPSEIPL